MVEGAPEDLGHRLRLCSEVPLYLGGRVGPDFQLNDPTVSRIHFCIQSQETGLGRNNEQKQNFVLFDLNSTAGIFQRVDHGGSEVRQGGVLQLGRTELLVREIVFSESASNARIQLEIVRAPHEIAPAFQRCFRIELEINGQRRIGRSEILSDPEISGEHAEFEFNGNGLLVRDLGSTNGTWLKMIEPIAVTGKMPDLKLGTTVLRVREGVTFGNLCCICLAESVEVVLVPCGHLCLCRVCGAQTSEKCPLCRSRVREVIRCFAS